MPVTVEHADQVDRHLVNVMNLHRFLVPAVGNAQQRMYTRLRFYPPPRGYARTYRYQKSIDKTPPTVNEGSATVSGVVFSHGAVGDYGQRYDHYLKMDRYQAWMHVGYWNTEAEDLRLERTNIIADIDRGKSEVILHGG